MGLPICKDRSLWAISSALVLGSGAIPQDRELKIGLHEEKCVQVVGGQAQSRGPEIHHFGFLAYQPMPDLGLSLIKCLRGLKSQK